MRIRNTAFWYLGQAPRCMEDSALLCNSDLRYATTKHLATSHPKLSGAAIESREISVFRTGPSKHSAVHQAHYLITYNNICVFVLVREFILIGNLLIRDVNTKVLTPPSPFSRRREGR